jgi:hypothetical protein
MLHTELLYVFTRYASIYYTKAYVYLTPIAARAQRYANWYQGSNGFILTPADSIT